MATSASPPPGVKVLQSTPCAPFDARPDVQGGKPLEIVFLSSEVPASRFSACTAPPHHTRQGLQVLAAPPIQTGIPIWDAKEMILAAALTAQPRNTISLLTAVNDSVSCRCDGDVL